MVVVVGNVVVVGSSVVVGAGVVVLGFRFFFLFFLNPALASISNPPSSAIRPP